MFIFTRAATLKIYDDFKKFIFIFSLAMQALYIGYLIYALTVGAGVLFANVTFLALSAIYTVLLAIHGTGKKQEDKSKLKTVGKIYRRVRIGIKALTLAATLYGIHIATTRLTTAAVILAAMTTIAWVLSVLFELVRIIFENYYELIEAALAKDFYQFKKILPGSEPPKIKSNVDGKLEALGGELKEKIDADRLLKNARKKQAKREKLERIRGGIAKRIKAILPSGKKNKISEESEKEAPLPEAAKKK